MPVMAMAVLPWDAFDATFVSGPNQLAVELAVLSDPNAASATRAI